MPFPMSSSLLLYLEGSFEKGNQKGTGDICETRLYCVIWRRGDVRDVMWLPSLPWRPSQQGLGQSH